MKTTQPMPSARLAPGRYEVLGTSQACEVVKVEDGWHLIVGGRFARHFATKREALQACQEDSSL